MKHRIVCIIPARSDSSRLPRKHLKLIRGTPMIGILISRMKTVKDIKEVIIATTDRQIDNELSEVSRRHGATVFRGSEKDVIGRFAKAASLSKATICIKANGDNPLQSPEVINLGVSQLLSSNLDIVTGKKKYSEIPIGLGAEVLSISAVRWLDENTSEEYREDTTSYLFNHKTNLKLEPISVPSLWKQSNESITIDTPNDLKKLINISSILKTPNPKDWSIKEILGAMNEYGK